MKTYALLLSFSVLISCNSQSQNNSDSRQTSLPDCEWCGAMDAPDDLDWKTTIAPENEPGEPMILTGTIYQSDGTIPAEGIVLYSYHTNSDGIYPKNGNETGNGQRHGFLRGWIKTGADGRYRIESIKPAPYSGRSESAHIHHTVFSDSFEEYWLESTLFQSDTLISTNKRIKANEMGQFSFIVNFEKDENGIWHGQRNFILKEK